MTLYLERKLFKKRSFINDITSSILEHEIFFKNISAYCINHFTLRMINFRLSEGRKQLGKDQMGHQINFLKQQKD